MAITLDYLIADSHRSFDTWYETSFTTHLPMTLFALQWLGANSTQLQTFAAQYSEMLNPLPLENHSICDESWLQYFGRRDYFLAYSRYFASQIEQYGAQATVRAYLSPLLPGIGGTGFHGLIRLAYGIEADCLVEIANGLAQLAAGWLSFGSFEMADDASHDVAAVLRKIAATPDLHFKPPASGAISDKMTEATKTLPRIIEAAGWLRVDNDTLSQLAAIAIQLFARYPELIELHLVTACHALRLILLYVDDRIVAIRYFWQALCAAYCTVGAPLLTAELNLEVDGTPDWAEISHHACQSFDEHVPKLVYTCREEATHYANPLYKAVASQAAYKGIASSRGLI